MVDGNAEVLAERLLSWPMSDRARLAELLLASLERGEGNTETAWDEEIGRRITELDSGEVRGIPAGDVLAEIDRRLAR